VPSQEAAELQALLEGVDLPAGRRELLDYARAEHARLELMLLLERLPEREYRSLDEVGEALEPVQPSWRHAAPQKPTPESGAPPGGVGYTDAAAEPGAVRERGPG
jgi:hypothetical protein